MDPFARMYFWYLVYNKWFRISKSIVLRLSERKSQIIIIATFGTGLLVAVTLDDLIHYPLLSTGIGLLVSPASLQSFVYTLTSNDFTQKDHIVALISIGIIVSYWIGILLFGFFTKGIDLIKRIIYVVLFASQISAVSFFIMVALMGETFSSFL